MPSTISLGSTGDDVKRLQRVLARHLMWNPFGPITGSFDAGLETAVKTFQQSQGLTVDGIVGPATWAALPSYREASRGTAAGLEGTRRCLASKGARRRRRGDFVHALRGCDRRCLRSRDRDGGARTANVGGHNVDGIVGDDTWFVWLTPGSAQQLTLEGACGLTSGLL